jgi:glycosyltransferase involved in cell wall biosynthesis
MRVAIVHGYILQGTGSNLYVTNLCRAFCKSGHEVILFSQEAQPQNFNFITQSYDFYQDCTTTTLTFQQKTTFPGKCIHYRPFINHFLPVFVYDDYPGYHVKTYTEASEKEIETYLSQNTNCLQTVFTSNVPDIILSQHTIMQPVYASRAIKTWPKTKQYINVHGSALNFSVRKKELLRTYAIEGIKNAQRLIFVSRHSQEDFVNYFSQIPSLSSKCKVIPAGVNIKLFSAPQSKAEIIKKLEHLVQSPQNTSDKNSQGLSSRDKIMFNQAIQENPDIASIKANIAIYNQNTHIWAQDQDIQQNLSKIIHLKGKSVLYFGKYLWTKGIHLLIAAAPLILAKYPDIHFILTGFGSTRAYLETLLNLIDMGHIDLFVKLLQEPYLVDSKSTGKSVYINDFLDWISKPENKESYRSNAFQNIRTRFIFTGIMSHSELRDLLPFVDATVAPSIFPESFGMVAIESLACGVTPVQTYHSGFADVVDHYENYLSDFFSSFPWKHLELNDGLIFSLASNIVSLMQALDLLSSQGRIELSQKMHTFVDKHYDWDCIAEKVLSS